MEVYAVGDHAVAVGKSTMQVEVVVLAAPVHTDYITMRKEILDSDIRIVLSIMVQEKDLVISGNVRAAVQAKVLYMD